jgi:hypothetical protein
MYNLTSTILSLPQLVGCKDFPDSQQGMKLVKLIQDFINEEYRVNGQQVTEAFKLAVKRELWLDGKRINPSTFGNHLSVNIVGQVLTAYKEHKRDSTARPSGYNYNQLPEAPKKNISDADAYDLVLKWTKEEGKPPFAAPYLGGYRYLLKNKQIKPVSKSTGGRFEDNFNGKEREVVEQWLLQNVLRKEKA